MEKSDWRDEKDVLRFSSAEIQRRHDRIRELMGNTGVDAIIIAGHPGSFGAEAANLLYISGVSYFFQGGYILFPLKESPVLYGASPVASERTKRVSWIDVETVAFKSGTRVRDYSTSIVSDLKKFGLDKSKIAIASMRVMPANVFLSIQRELPEAEFVSGDEILLECRRVKSLEEIEFIRKAGECADRGIEAMIDAARPGASEEELAAECDMAMVRAGSRRGNFILLGSGSWKNMNGAIGEAGTRRLQKGDIILNEITSCYEGYYTQLCVPISIGGDVPDDFMGLLSVHEAMYNAAFYGLRPGTRILELEKKVYNSAASFNPGFGRAWATQTTELAEAFFKADLELVKGMSYVIHPWTEPSSGPGHFGHLIGNTCIVTDGEPEVVHKSALDLRVV